MDRDRRGAGLGGGPGGANGSARRVTLDGRVQSWRLLCQRRPSIRSGGPQAVVPAACPRGPVRRDWRGGRGAGAGRRIARRGRSTGGARVIRGRPGDESMDQESTLELIAVEAAGAEDGAEVLRLRTDAGAIAARYHPAQQPDGGGRRRRPVEPAAAAARPRDRRRGAARPLLARAVPPRRRAAAVAAVSRVRARARRVPRGARSRPAGVDRRGRGVRRAGGRREDGRRPGGTGRRPAR